MKVLGSADRGRLGGRRFLRYLRRTSAGGAVEYAAQLLDGLIRPELLRSGAIAGEEHRPLPGDDLVPDPVWEATRAVTIDAPPAEVWPWLAQMGYGRGGWYGWNPLEREDTGVSRLLEELPPPRVGDVWLDGPGCDATKGAWNVRAVEPPRTLVLHSMRNPITGRELDPAEKPRLFIDSAWAFHLDQIAPRRSRLLARTRIRMMPRWTIGPLKWMGSGDTVMQRRLLDGIKVRVEAASQRSGAGRTRSGHGGGDGPDPSWSDAGVPGEAIRAGAVAWGRGGPRRARDEPGSPQPG